MKSDIKYTYFHNLHYLNNSFEKILKGLATLTLAAAPAAAAAAAAPRLTQYTLEDCLLCNQIRICAFKHHILQ